MVQEDGAEVPRLGATVQFRGSEATASLEVWEAEYEDRAAKLEQVHDLKTGIADNC